MPFAVQGLAPAGWRSSGENKYVQLVSRAGHESAMYELRTDGLRRTSNGNLPPEVVAAFARAGG